MLVRSITPLSSLSLVTPSCVDLEFNQMRGSVTFLSSYHATLCAPGYTHDQTEALLHALLDASWHFAAQ